MTVLNNVNAMPAITWHFLKANDAAVQVPEGLAIAPYVRVQGPWLEGDCVVVSKILPYLFTNVRTYT